MIATLFALMSNSDSFRLDRNRYDRGVLAYVKNIFCVRHYDVESPYFVILWLEHENTKSRCLQLAVCYLPPYTDSLSLKKRCNVRRIVACLCLPVTLALRFSLIVLIAVTRPRVIDGPRFLCNSAYLEECCFFRVIGTLKRVSIRKRGSVSVYELRTERWSFSFGRRIGLCSTRLI